MRYTRIYTTIALTAVATFQTMAQFADPFDSQRSRRNSLNTSPVKPDQVILAAKADPLRSVSITRSYQPEVALGKTASIFEVAEATEAYVNLNQAVLNPSADKAISFDVTRSYTDANNCNHIRVRQSYMGYPVYGTELIVHSNATGQIESMNGTMVPSIKPATTVAKINRTAALDAANATLRSVTAIRELNALEKATMEYEGPSASLIIYQNSNLEINPALAWEVQVRPNLLESWTVYVDALTGKTLNTENKTCAADGPRTSTISDINSVSRVINTYQVGNTYYLIDGSKSMFNPTSVMPDHPKGVIWTLDAGNTELLTLNQITTLDNQTWSSKAVSAQYNASTVYDYFKNTHGQNSIDNNNGNVISIINVTLPGGNPMDNMFWNGHAIFYGNGGTSFRPLVGSLDMAAHEYTHGVIQSLCNLEYQGQSGAISEALADAFGCMLDKSNWTIGEQVVKAATYPSGALRNVQDPHNSTTMGNPGWQPNHMSEYVLGSADNGGVHANSGILNRAFYLICNTITTTKAEKIYFRAMSTYLTRYAQFNDFRNALVLAASELYGATSSEVTTIKTSFDAVGIFDNGNGPSHAIDIAANSGNQRLCYYDPTPQSAGKLYMTQIDGSSPTAISQTPSKRAPSVTDDGQTCYFVDPDGKIRRINLEGVANETVLFPTQNNFLNVAVSKDGTKLAAVKTDPDTSLYIYHIQNNQWTQFKVQHQSGTAGMNAPGLQYLDGIEWDYSGEYILFDARYTIGDRFTFWRIGTINVWNNITNGPGNGHIETILSDLNDSISVGNAHYSKNSPYIIAYDRFDRRDSTYQIMTRNLINGQGSIVTNNNWLGNPSYSRLDDKILYTTGDLGLQDYAVYCAPMNANKLEAAGPGTLLIGHATIGQWITSGTRTLMNNSKSLLSYQLSSLTPKAQGVIIGDSVLVRVTETSVLTNVVADFVVSPNCIVTVNNAEQVSGNTRNNFSNNVVYKITARDNSTRQITVITQRPSNTKEITAFSFQDLTPVVNGFITDDTIELYVPGTTDITGLTATFTASAFAKVTVNNVAQKSGITMNDFSTPLTYRVTAYDSTTHDYVVIVNVINGVRELGGSQAVNVYPNPTTGIVYADLKGPFTFQVFDLSGKEVLNGLDVAGGMHLESLQKGAYLVQLRQNGNSYYAKVFLSE